MANVNYLLGVEAESAEALAVAASAEVAERLKVLLRLEARCTSTVLRTHEDVDRLVGHLDRWVEKAGFTNSFFPLRADIFLNTGQVSPHVVSRDGDHPITLITERLSKLGINALPVTECGRNARFDQGFRAALEFSNGRAALIVNSQLFLNDGWRAKIKRKLAESSLRAGQTDLIINWGDASQYNKDWSFCRSHLMQILDLGPWSRVYSIQSACPQTLSNYPEGVTEVPRLDWELGMDLISIAADQHVDVDFGDYLIGSDLPRDLSAFRRRGRAKYIATSESHYQFIRGGKINKENAAKQFESIVSKARELPDYEGDTYCAGNRILGEIAAGRLEIRENKKLVFAAQNRHIIRVANSLQDI